MNEETYTTRLTDAIATLYSGEAMEGDETEVRITGHVVWLAQQALKEQEEVHGDLVQAGRLTMKDAEYERAVVIAFDDDESARKAIQSGQCWFTVFGGEV